MYSNYLNDRINRSNELVILLLFQVNISSIKLYRYNLNADYFKTMCTQLNEAKDYSRGWSVLQAQHIQQYSTNR